MATWIWIVIAIAVLIVLGLAVMGMRQRRETEQRRDQARELRQQADARVEHAETHERQAREARKAAVEVGARADRLDPDSETPYADD